MSAACLLLFAVASPQETVPLPENDPVFVELTHGRGTLLAGDSTVQLSNKSGEQWVEGRGHLSLKASATAVLRWHRRASLKLVGPCELEWEAGSQDEAVEWDFHSLTRAELESRWSDIKIGLGENWSVLMPPGAMQIRALRSTSWEIFQDAGSAATYSWEGDPKHTRPTRVGIIGRPIRLSADPTPSRADHSAQLDGRLGWTWPWRDESPDDTSWGYRDWPWVAGPPKPVTVRVIPTPAPIPPHAPDQYLMVEVPEATAEELTAPPQEPVVVLPPPIQPAPVVPEAQTPAPLSSPDGDGTWGWESRESDASGPWRGLSDENYMPFGDYFIQSESGISSEELPDGGVRFWIPEQSQASAWVLGPRLDSRLDPGGLIEYGPGGALRAHAGGVRVLAALER